MIDNIIPITVRTPERVAKASYFTDLCGGDTQYLSVLDNDRRSSFAHCGEIVLKSDRLGYSNILLPTSYTVGQDVLTFAAGMAKAGLPLTSSIQICRACARMLPFDINTVRKPSRS